MGGRATDTVIDIETVSPNDKIRGVEAIKVLHDAIGQILEEIT